MKRSAPMLLAVATAAVVLVAAREAPANPAVQDSNACWFQGKPENIAKRASPHDSASVSLGDGTVKVCYGRPHQKGREIMGKLVPYGEPWRMGADEATAIHVSFPARIAGVDVAPGWYSIYAVPDAKQWKIVVNSNAQRWGIPIDESVRTKDVGAGTVEAEHSDKPVEEMTIALRATSSSVATMEVAWESTRVEIPIVRR